MSPLPEVNDNAADELIKTCLHLPNPKSFFLFAGAGSGKTRSLVHALKYLLATSSKDLQLRGQQIAVITYTNAACDEIKRRLDYHSLIEVSTIHSFTWSLIKHFHNDINEWLTTNLRAEIVDLENKQRTGRPGKAANDRLKSIESKSHRLTGLDQIRSFSYNPLGDNREQDSLNHSEVLKIGSFFLSSKSLMQRLLVCRHPVLLIDESQDTNKALMDAFLHVQALHQSHFGLGLFGDTMQRIYMDGKIGLGSDLPADWVTPVKRMNYRSPTRIIHLLNKIRADVDSREQQPGGDKEAGIIRCFILGSDTSDKLRQEGLLAARMARITNDAQWLTPDKDVKTLFLEHHMAARRMGFIDMYAPLYSVERIKTGLLDGTHPGIRFFSALILPLIAAKRNNNDFAVASIVRSNSPLLAKKSLKALLNNQLDQIRKANTAVTELLALFSENSQLTFLEVLLSVAQTGLFEIPEVLRPITARSALEQDVATQSITDASGEGEPDEGLGAWDKFLSTPFLQIENYDKYISGESNYDTHQGVKGLEFPRVAVVIDDTEARGFSFSYEKLFGAKQKTPADIQNELEGNETTIDRTKRLFYVTCSRAQKSLMLIAYSENPEKVREQALVNEWFSSEEIEIVV